MGDNKKLILGTNGRTGNRSEIEATSTPPLSKNQSYGGGHRHFDKILDDQNRKPTKKNVLYAFERDLKSGNK